MRDDRKAVSSSSAPAYIVRRRKRSRNMPVIMPEPVLETRLHRIAAAAARASGVRCGSCIACISKVGDCTLGRRPPPPLRPAPIEGLRLVSGRDVGTTAKRLERPAEAFGRMLDQLPPDQWKADVAAEFGFTPCREERCQNGEVHEARSAACIRPVMGRPSLPLER